jgi:hypothetical protein
MLKFFVLVNNRFYEQNHISPEIHKNEVTLYSKHKNIIKIYYFGFICFVESFRQNKDAQNLKTLKKILIIIKLLRLCWCLPIGIHL